MTLDHDGPNSLFWFKQRPCHFPADFNGDGGIDFFDYPACQCVSRGGTSADFNPDGGVDFFDYLDFMDRYTSGC